MSGSNWEEGAEGHDCRTHLEQQADAHDQRLGRDEVFLAADHEGTGGEVLARLRSLADLIVVHPVRPDHDLGVPGRAVARGHLPGLGQRLGGHLPTGRVLDHAARSAMEVGMDVDVTLGKIAPHDLLVLLSISPADHKVILGRDKPEELFKPVTVRIREKARVVEKRGAKR